MILMTVPLAIYKLEPIMDDPMFEGFAPADQPSLLGRRDRYEDLCQTFDAQSSSWKTPRLAESWQPLRVHGRVRPFNDFPCLLDLPAFSFRAVEVLRDVLGPNGELLPLETSIGPYFLFNCTTVADLIDMHRSRFTPLNRDTILEIDRFEIKQDLGNGWSIFEMRMYPGRCFVTDSVARRIRESKLAGFELRKFWPLPDDVVWWMHRKDRRCHDELTKQP
jgi:hypothetical protein